MTQPPMERTAPRATRGPMRRESAAKKIVRARAQRAWGLSQSRGGPQAPTSQNLDRDARPEAIDDNCAVRQARAPWRSPRCPARPRCLGALRCQRDRAVQLKTALSSEPALYGVNQPAFERITLGHDRVRVRIAGRSPSDATEGHWPTRRVSGLLIRVPSKPTLPKRRRRPVPGLAGGLEVTFRRDGPRPSTSVAVQYFAGDSTLRFRLRFMAEAPHAARRPAWIGIKTRPATPHRNPGSIARPEMAVL